MIEVELPYPGLRAFTRDESDLFFGRANCVNSMIERLASTRFLAVLGASGSGKSSLVHTGLIDALELGFFANAGSRWTVCSCHPGDDPLARLAAVLEGVAVPGSELPKGTALVKYLARGPRSVVEWCAAGGLAPRHNLLLIIDQFEELFQYASYASRPQTEALVSEAREQAEAFVALLIGSARAVEAPIHIVLTMRSEYLGACSLIPGLAEQVNASFYLTPRMTRTECKQAIEGPAAVRGFTVTPDLVNHLLNDMASFAPWDEKQQINQAEVLSRRADLLPVMQHLLNRMWLLAKSREAGGEVTLTLEEYAEVGGLRNALNDHGEQVLQSVPEQYRADAEPIFRALVSGIDTSDAVHSPRRFRDLCTAAAGGEAAARVIVDRFRGADCNFLQPGRWDRLDPDTSVKISHESLIRQWNKLAEWTRDESEAGDRWRKLVLRAQSEKHGEGSLLTKLDLSSADAWWTAEQPTQGWAERHGNNYELASSFLDRSRAAASQQRRQVTWLLAAATTLLLAMIGLYYWNHQRELVKERDTLQAKLSMQEALTKKAQAEKDIAYLASQKKDLNTGLSELTDQQTQLEQNNETLTVEGARDQQKINDQTKALSFQRQQMEEQVTQITQQRQQLLDEQQQSQQTGQQIAQQRQQLKDQGDLLAAKEKAIEQLDTAIALAGKAPSKPVTAANDPQVTIFITSGPASDEKPYYKLAPELYIDNIPYAFVQPGTYYSARVPAGQHVLCVADPFSPCESTDFQAAAGGNLQLRVDYVHDKKRGRYVPNGQYAALGAKSGAMVPLPQVQVIRTQ